MEIAFSRWTKKKEDTWESLDLQAMLLKHRTHHRDAFCSRNIGWYSEIVFERKVWQGRIR